VHPIFRHPLRLLGYVLAWTPVGGVLAYQLARRSAVSFGAALAFEMPLALLYGLMCLSAYWVCRARPLTRDRLAGVAQLGTAVPTSAVWTAAAALWAMVLAGVFHTGPGTDGLWGLLERHFLVGIPVYFLSAVVHYLYLALEESHEAAERVLESQLVAREAELRAARAQLSPHFLFNSLNSINALVGNDPEGARRMCEGLGDFLRRTLALGARAEVTLGDELALVDRYLAIEQVRFGERLCVVRAIEPAARACTLPPLLLQPLVENAIKHGVAGRIEGGTLSISAARRGGRLVVALENPVDEGGPARDGEGLGLDIVRRRLRHHGSGDARRAVVHAPGMFRVTLDLPATPLGGA